MLKLINIIVFLQIFLHFEFGPCNMLQKNWGKKRKIEECSKDTFWNILQKNRLIGNSWVLWLGVKGESPKKACSQARMGQGSPLYEQLVQQFKINVSQYTMARSWGISSTTARNIFRWFREKGRNFCTYAARLKTNTECPWPSILQSPLILHSLKNQHQRVKDITTLSQKHSGKPLWVNTVHCHIYKCKLKFYHA